MDSEGSEIILADDITELDAIDREPSTIANGITPLMEMAKQGNDEDVVRIMEENNDDTSLLYREDPNGWIALSWAVVNGHVATAQILVEHGSDIDHSDRSGWTALILAVRNDDIPMAAMLLQHDADINCKTSGYGFSPLMTAARYGFNGMVKFLLENGASVDDENLFGWTSLSFAAANGHTDTANLLIEHGADLHHESSKTWGDFVVRSDRRGWTPKRIAAHNFHTDTVNLFIQAEAASSP